MKYIYGYCAMDQFELNKVFRSLVESFIVGHESILEVQCIIAGAKVDVGVLWITSIDVCFDCS